MHCNNVNICLNDLFIEIKSSINNRSHSEQSGIVIPECIVVCCGSRTKNNRRLNINGFKPIASVRRQLSKNVYTACNLLLFLSSQSSLMIMKYDPENVYFHFF